MKTTKEADPIEIADSFIHIVRRYIPESSSMVDNIFVKWYDFKELIDFYSQPFNIEMLANPFEFPEYEGWAGKEKDYNKAMEE